MLTLVEFKDYIKSLALADHVYMGKIDAGKEKTIGVYDRNAGRYTAAIGGVKKYGIKDVSVLVHWTKNARQTEEAALSLYEALKSLRDVTMGETLVFFALPQNNAPVDVGSDDNGVYEMVIQLELYYERTIE